VREKHVSPKRAEQTTREKRQEAIFFSDAPFRLLVLLVPSLHQRNEQRKERRRRRMLCCVSSLVHESQRTRREKNQLTAQSHEQRSLLKNGGTRRKRNLPVLALLRSVISADLFISEASLDQRPQPHSILDSGSLQKFSERWVNVYGCSPESQPRNVPWL